MVLSALIYAAVVLAVVWLVTEAAIEIARIIWG